MLSETVRRLREQLHGLYLSGAQMDQDTLAVVLFSIVQIEAKALDLEERLQGLPDPPRAENIIPFPRTPRHN